MSLAPVLALLRREMGLNPASVGESTVAHAMRRRMAAVGCTDAADYATRLGASQEELQELIEEVAVPETWFFREDSAFECLRQHVQHVLPSAGKPRLFHFACLPCATGEEAYSIAMNLLDMGLPPARFRVHALDISYRALIRAQQGLYGEYSFRGADQRLRARYFQTAADAHQVDQAVRDQVSFYQGSALALPSPFNALTYDVVFCRNLLIYLDAEARQRVVAGLKGMLAADGILLVGHSETSIVLHEGFVRSANGALRVGRVAALPASPPPARRQPRAGGATRAAGSLPAIGPMPFATPVALSRVADAANATGLVIDDRGGGDLGQIRALADAGQLEEAAACCAELVRAGMHSAELYCLQGLVGNAQGNPVDARACFRKALYLDPALADASLQLSLLDQRSGVERRVAGERMPQDDRRQRERHDG